MEQPQTQPQSTVLAPPGRDTVLRIIDAQAIDTVFQPIVDLTDGQIIAFEALSRPRCGFSSPSDLFSVAEREDLLWPLESFTRSMAVEAAAAWPTTCKLFCNCSPQVLADARFPDVLAESVARFPSLSPGRIVLEITERCDDRLVDGLQDQVVRLKSMGFQIAMDDVGVGASGLGRIMKLRPHWLKLDHAFIQGIHTDPFKQNLVRFFVHFARLSNLSVIAEGIEAREELATVVGLGVRHGQGFYLGRPTISAAATDPEYAKEVQARWSEVEVASEVAAGITPLRRLCQNAQVIQAMTPAAVVAASLLRRPEDSGVVVMDGRRYLGWCSRDKAIEEAQTNGGRRPIASVTSNGVCAVAPDASIHDGLQVLCVREEAEIGEPLVIADGEQIVGIVKLRDLLLAAAAETSVGLASRVGLAGLPSRVKADQHLAALINAYADDPTLTAECDAAMVDIRRFADFNSAYGYELGDTLIRDLGDLLRSSVVRSDSLLFLAYLGDDRFLLTGDPETLRHRLSNLVSTFDKYFAAPLKPSASATTVPDQEAPFASLRESIPCPGLGLRVLVMPGVFRRVRHPRDIFRIEQQLRQRARRDERALASGGSVMVIDTRLDDLRARVAA